MRKFINKLLSYESIDGGGICPPYLNRWTLLSIGETFKIYLHQFVGDDWAIDPHDHPKRFISIGLKGWYYEDVYNKNGGLIRLKKHKAPWLRTFPATHVHRIRASECGNCWTLVITLKPTREWGFIRLGVWHEWKHYVYSGLSRKNC